MSESNDTVLPSSTLSETTERSDKISISIPTDTVIPSVSQSILSVVILPSETLPIPPPSPSSNPSNPSSSTASVPSSTVTSSISTVVNLNHEDSSVGNNHPSNGVNTTDEPQRIINPVYRLDLSVGSTGISVLPSSSSSSLSTSLSSPTLSSSPSPSSSNVTVQGSNTGLSFSTIRRSPFDTLPDDTLQSIFNYLSATDISRIAQVNQQLHKYTKSPNLWFNLFLHDFDVSTSDIGTLQLGARKAYINRIVNRQKRIQQISEKKSKEELEAQAERAQLRLGLFLVILNILTWLVLPFLLLLIFFILVAVKLDNGISSPWSMVFIPVYIWIFLVLITSIIQCHIYRINHNGNGISVLSVWYGQSSRLVWTPPHLVMEHIFGNNRRGILYGCTLIGILLLLIPLLVMKLENIGDEQYTWAMTFIPLWLVTCLLPCGLRLGWCHGMERDSKILLLIMVITLFLPFLIVVILLVVSLDNNFSISLSFIFIPFWIINALIALLLVCHCGFTVYRVARGNDRDDLLFFLSMIFAVGIIVLPPLLTLVFLTYRVDNINSTDRSWKRTLGSFWFTLILGLLLSWGGGCSAWAQFISEPLAERRQTEPDPFSSRETMDRVQDMYRRHIQTNNLGPQRGSTNGLPRT